MSDWSTHYNSWKNIKFCPIKIIKYEDIVKDPKKNFISVLNFLSNFIKIDIDERKIKNCLKTTDFNIFIKLENKQGFIESVSSTKNQKKIKFFNKGKKNDWKKLLNNNLNEMYKGGCWGVPTVRLSKINSDYEYYQWGQDRIHFIEKEIISILNFSHP